MKMPHSPARVSVGVILLWAGLIAFDTTAQLLFKSAALGMPQPEASLRWLRGVAESTTFWVGALSLALTFMIWMLILRGSQLTLVFPATALTYVGVIGGSRWIFGESIEPLQYAGIALIVVGVALLRRPSA
jgi:multidrug transporter EmrE-like cation transporter